MKSSDEIKKGLESCAAMVCGTLKKIDCPYAGMKLCHDRVLCDALARIRQLEAENERLLNSYDAALCETGDMHAICKVGSGRS